MGRLWSVFLKVSLSPRGAPSGTPLCSSYIPSSCPNMDKILPKCSNCKVIILLYEAGRSWNRPGPKNVHFGNTFSKDQKSNTLTFQPTFKKIEKYKAHFFGGADFLQKCCKSFVEINYFELLTVFLPCTST